MSILLPAGTPLLAGIFGLSGIGVWLSGRREFLLRWLSFFAATPVLMLAAATGRAGATVFGAVIVAICGCEFARLLDLDRWLRSALALGLAGVLVSSVTEGAIPMAAVLMIGVAVPVFGARSVDGLRQAALVTWGIAWLGGAAAALPALGSGLLPIAVAVSVGDVGAYFGGSVANRFSGRWPAVATRLNALSPNKTWAGAVAGSITAVGTLFVLHGLSAPAALAVTAGAVLGDLVESMLKRSAGVKNAGSWLPGFGGLLDRVDSLLGALLVLAVLA